MSWLRDPQLFMYKGSGGQTSICRVNKTLSIGTGLQVPGGDISDFVGYIFSTHLSLGINKESDYAAFISYLRNKPENTLMNCQGLVAYQAQSYILSREDPNSPVYSLPGILIASIDAQQQQKQALDRKLSDLETMNSTLRNKENRLTAEVSDLQRQLKQEKSDKQALQKKASDSESMSATWKNNENKLTAQVSDLEKKLKQEKNDKEALEKQIIVLKSKLEEGSAADGGSADEEQWMSTGHTVPSNWVPFDDLDVQAFPKDNHLTITKVMGARKFGEDPTTNVQSKRFYRGVFPIVAVNVAELIPNQDDARFDPEIWSLYINQGTCYAARKPFESEM